MTEVRLRIDTKYNHFHIHRQALYAIEDPPFLNFAYDPESMELMVIGTWIDDLNAVRVNYTKNGSVLFFSKPLITGIRTVSNILTKSGSYFVDGKVIGKSIIYPLGNAKMANE